MWRYHLTSTPWRVGVTSGVTFGVITAAPAAVQFGPVPGAVAFGVGATIFGIIIGPSSRQGLAPLAGLSPADRATVMCTVQRGLPTHPRLAAAVVGYVEAGRRRTPAWMARDNGARLFYVLAGVQVLSGAFNAVDRDWTGVALHIAVAVTALLMPRLNARNIARRDQAERSARALLEQG